MINLVSYTVRFRAMFRAIHKISLTEKLSTINNIYTNSWKTTKAIKLSVGWGWHYKNLRKTGFRIYENEILFRFMDELQDIDVVEDSAARIDCRLGGFPDPTVT